MAPLDGRTAVVTGASRGIGAGIAEALGSQGVRVVLIARTEAKLEERAARIKGSIPVTCDVTDPKSVERATKRIATELNGAPDILVNNAGYTASPSRRRRRPNHSSRRSTPISSARFFLSAHFSAK